MYPLYSFNFLQPFATVNRPPQVVASRCKLLPTSAPLRILQEPLPDAWGDAHPLHKLILLRLLRPDKLVPAITAFICTHMGQRFTMPPVFDLGIIYGEASNPWIPLVFILSSGADPNAALLTFADSCRMGGDRLLSLSLGQGMAKRASDFILQGKSQGMWVVLQNCHLYADWMPALERIVEDYSQNDVRGGVHQVPALLLGVSAVDSRPPWAMKSQR